MRVTEEEDEVGGESDILCMLRCRLKDDHKYSTGSPLAVQYVDVYIHKVLFGHLDKPNRYPWGLVAVRVNIRRTRAHEDLSIVHLNLRLRCEDLHGSAMVANVSVVRD